MDKSELFMHPVDREEVPDYYDVIKEPMCWSQIDNNIEQMGYLSTEAFKVGNGYGVPNRSATSCLYLTTQCRTTSPRPRSTAPRRG